MLSANSESATTAKLRNLKRFWGRVTQQNRERAHDDDFAG